MSYTEMYLVPVQGEVECVREFSNSYHGAILLWTHLAKRYMNQDFSAAMIKVNYFFHLVMSTLFFLQIHGQIIAVSP